MTLRAFHLQKDTGVMIPLIQAAFEYPDHENWSLSSAEITNFVDSLRLLSRLYPLFQLGGLFNPTLKSVMRGFIWEEEGQALGLVNLSPFGLDPQTWMIGNVAVLPDHRRKGIARQLIQAAVSLARQHQVKHLVLEVIADNLPAVTLYENQGFEIYSAVGQLTRDAALEAPPLPVLPPGYRIESYRTRDWEARYRLMKTITPPGVQQYEPVHRKKFYKTPFMRLLRSLILIAAPLKNPAYLVWHQATGTVVARFACYQRTGAGGVNEIEIDLDPDHAVLAPYLVQRCVHETLQVSPGRDIELRNVGWQPGVLQSALDAGFVYRTEWKQMGMHLDHA